MRKRDKRRLYFGMGIGVLIASSTSPAVSAAVQVAVPALAPAPAIVDTTQYENGRFPDSALADIGGGFKLAPSAANAFIRMRSAAGGAGVTIGVSDAYRSFDQQVAVAKQKGLYSEGGLAAKPGTSDHGRGLSVDLALNNAAAAWMKNNAGGFGFINNVAGESWHWTYKPFTGAGYDVVDSEIVFSYYNELRSRYANNPAGNKILLATFEAALAESNFRNLNHGDRDSLGVFQQRSGWGSAEDRQKPGYALKRFLEKLDSVQKKTPDLAPHELAQETQRSHCVHNAPNDADCHGIWGGNYRDEENRARTIINRIGGPFPGAGSF